MGQGLIWVAEEEFLRNCFVMTSGAGAGEHERLPRPQTRVGCLEIHLLRN